MIDKTVPSVEAAVAGIHDGATVMIGGFGLAGMPAALIDALIAQGARYRAGDIELELVPQGNLAERIRAAGAGIGAFFTPTGFGTLLAEGKETRRINGRDYVLEYPIHGDFALIKALKADRWGNLVYRKTARNFGPIMATAARCAIVQVDEIVDLGALDPECIVTPGIHVQRVVKVPTRPATAAAPADAAAAGRQA